MQWVFINTIISNGWIVLSFFLSSGTGTLRALLPHSANTAHRDDLLLPMSIYTSTTATPSILPLFACLWATILQLLCHLQLYRTLQSTDQLLAAPLCLHTPRRRPLYWLAEIPNDHIFFWTSLRTHTDYPYMASSTHNSSYSLRLAPYKVRTLAGIPAHTHYTALLCTTRTPLLYLPHPPPVSLHHPILLSHCIVH